MHDQLRRRDIPDMVPSVEHAAEPAVGGEGGVDPATECSGAYFAAGSGCIRPRMFPSGSFTYASQPTVGIGIFGSATVPPRLSALAKKSSTDGTSTVPTNALTLCPSEGRGPCR